MLPAKYGREFLSSPDVNYVMGAMYDILMVYGAHWKRCDLSQFELLPTLESPDSEPDSELDVSSPRFALALKYPR